MHVLNHETNCVKSDFKEIFLKLVANDRSDKRFLLTSKFCPLVLSAPDMWLYMFIKSCKDVYKVRGWKDSFLNLQQMTIVMRPSCWIKNFGPNELSAPAQGLCLNFFSSVTADCNISSALRWAIQDHWSSGCIFTELVHSILIGSSSNLLVIRAGIKSQRCLNPGQIWPVSSKLRALEGRKTSHRLIMESPRSVGQICR